MRTIAAAQAGAVLLSALLGTSAHAAVAADQEWPVYGGDPGGLKYSPLAEVNRTNASTLRLAWIWETGEQPLPEHGTTPGMFEATPLVVDGVMYLSTPYNRVVALDAASGRELWSHDPGAYRAGQPLNGTGFVHRGVALWRDTKSGALRVFMNSRRTLLQLDAATGARVGAFGDNGAVDLLAGLQWPVDPKHYTNTSPPVVYRDLVILGNGVADRLVYPRDPPGDVRAFDARTGAPVWSFHTVPRDGEPGVETWENGAHRYTGHANVWAPMTLDAARGLLYLPVSTPSNDFYGGRRPGAGLYGDSLVCLDAATGALRWYRQLVHHGLWDYDPPAPPVLATLTIGGRRVDAAVQLTKQGFVFVFDRVTGEPLYPIEERAVPPSDVTGERAWPTQPFSTALPPLVPQGVSLADATDLTPELHAEAIAVLKQVRLGPLFTPPSREGTLFRPGLIGGAGWGGGALDPESGVLYAKVNDAPDLIYPDIPDAAGRVPEIGPNDAPAVSLLLRHRIPVLKPPYAYLDALDLGRAKMLWQRPFGDNKAVRNHPALAGVALPPRLGAVGSSGVIVTRGGLVFGGGGDTAVHAVDATTGEELWRYDTGELRANATPMTYRLRGRQYLVIAVGGPGPGATLLAFALPDGGTAVPTSTSGPATQRVAIDDVAWLSGWPAGSAQRIAARACSQCHAPGVVQASRLTRAQWASQVDAMITRGAQLGDAEIEPLLDYLATHFGAPAHL